jgi:hypothetical protein
MDKILRERLMLFCLVSSLILSLSLPSPTLDHHLPTVLFLIDNLPPNLQKMDRTTKSAWMGKSSTDSTTAVSRKGNEIKYTLEMSSKDKEIQKIRLRF